MNDDRISEVYKGEIWSEEAQERARRRVNWLCRNVRGERVLDIGTSQGIVPILLGREGFEVVGVDIQVDRIDYAREDLARESEGTQERVEFLVGEGASLDFPDESFDAIVLGEVLEHLAQPQRVLAEVARLLRPQGRLVLTTPFGDRHPHHDHKQTFYPDDLLELLDGYVGVTSAEVVDDYFRIIGVNGEATDPAVPGRLRASAFEAVRATQEALAATTRRLAAAETSEASAKGELEDARSELRRAEQVIDQQLADLEVARQRARELAERRDLLEHRVEVERWKLEVTKQRRWWRIGSLLGELRRRPWRLPFVLVALMRLLVDEQPRPARPEPPESVRDSSGPSTPVPALADALLPRHDLVGVGVVGARTRELLDHELLFWRLERDSWAQQLESLRPQVVVLERDEVRRWGESAVAAVRESAAGSGAQIIEIAPDREGASLHPRLHRPAGSNTRGNGHAVVDPTSGVVDGTSYADEEAFVAAVRHQAAVVVSGNHPSTALARIAATSTPMVVRVEDREAPFGISVRSAEASQSALAALRRSEVFAARRAHQDMRRAIRDHDIGLALDVHADRTPPVDVMVATMRPHRLENLLDNLGRQTYPNTRLFLVTHGVEFDAVKVRDLADERGVEVAGVWSEPGDVVLGEVFNRGFSRTEAKLVAKMDDDDYYGAEYLWDLISAKDASGADVAGKWAHYVHLEGPDTTIYRFRHYEHRFTDVVAISTLLMDRAVFDDEQFPSMPYGSGSVFLRSIGAAGARIFAADRWNYVYFRGAEGKRNTFPVSDLKMLSNSDVICAGFVLDEITA